MLLAPALWNGYPLLQWDTGGYLARWYEGYLVPSRSTAFGLYLHYGEESGFWVNLGTQALATLWILQLILRVSAWRSPCGCWRLSFVLISDHRAAMACKHAFNRHLCRPLRALALHPGRAWRGTTAIEKCSLFAFTAFAAASHSATLAVLLGLCCVGWIARPFLGGRIAVSGLAQGSLTIVPAAMLLSANFALSGQLAWTPGGYGVAFGRMLQDGIVARYLSGPLPGRRN